MEKTKLPKDWKWVKFGELCEKVESVKRKEKDLEHELLYLDIGGIDNVLNKIESHKSYKWKDAPSRAQQIVHLGDILFSTVRTYMKNIALIENEKFHLEIASSGFCVIRADKNLLNNKYTFYYTISQQFLRPLNELQTGSSYPAVRDKDVFSQIIPLPPLKTQKQIVSKIEELFSELDKGVEDLKKAQQQLKTYRQSVLKWAFEGRLTNENVKDGVLPKDWEHKSLGEIFKVSSGKGIKINQLKGGEFPVYGGNGLNGYHTDYYIEERVLIIGRVGVKCGVTHITKPKSWVSDNALIVKPIIEDFDIMFFKLRLEFENINRLSVSTAQPVISGNSIYSVLIYFPKIKEQKQIVQEIESRLSVADKLEENIKESLQQAEALRQSILKKAFCGELI